MEEDKREETQGPLEPSPETLSLGSVRPDSGSARVGEAPGGAGAPDARWLANYRMVKKLGEGGMGVVYEAEQQNPKRSVALKVIRGGAFVDDHSVRLFQREVESLARLKHPGIAAIYEAGSTETGQRFFTMELVQGLPWDAYLRARPLTGSDPRGQIRARLAVFLKVCQAINYAHQRGVIHRDLKPSNIMVVSGTEAGTGSSTSRAESQVKILDFGLARMTDADAAEASVLTQVGQIQGSVPYMSPEQAEGRVEEIDLRTDVYSLGVILYEILTDRPPYDLRGLMLHEALRVIREQSPPRPGGLQRALRGDLETIALKALEKEPARRYQSVLALAEDIERFLTDQPILAHPPSLRYQTRKLIARHKPAFAGAVVVLVLLIAFAVTMSVMFGIQRRERLRADAAKRVALLEAEKAKQITSFLQQMLASVDPQKALGREVTVKEVLDEAAGRVQTGLAGQPEVAAAVRSTIGLTYLALRDFQAAEPHLRAALAERERILGANDLEVTGSLNDLAALCRARGDYAEAEPLLRRALALQRKLAGEESAEVAASLSNLGVLLKDEGKFSAAESLCRQGLALRERLYKEGDPEVAVSLSVLASVLQAQGKPEEAEAYCRRALAIRRQLLGERHPDVALSLSNLASILQAEGKYAPAESLMRESLTMGKAMFGPDDPMVASTLCNLALVLSYEDKYAQAESLYRQAIGLYKKRGDIDPSAVSAVNNLAGLLQTEGRPAEAEPLYRQTLEMKERLYGPEHPSVAMSLNNLAIVLRDQGKLDQAGLLFRQGLAMRRKLLGASHPHVANSLLGLGSLLLQSGKPAEAEPLLRECLAIRQRARSPEPWQIAVVENALGACLARERRYAEAESLLRKSTPVILGSTAASPEFKREALRRTIAFDEATGRTQSAVRLREELKRLGR